MIAFEEQNVFSVISNSTVAALAFDSEARELSFTVSGHFGTWGFVKVIIANQLVADVENLEVKLNDEEVDYSVTALDDSWLVYLTYLHSTHSVTVSLGELRTGLFPERWDLVAIAVSVVFAIVGTTLSFLFRRRLRGMDQRTRVRAIALKICLRSIFYMRLLGSHVCMHAAEMKVN